MGEVADVFATEFRAFALDGVPASGREPVSVAGARSIGAFLEALMKARLLSDLPGGPGSAAGKRQWGIRVNEAEDGFEFFDRGLLLCNCYSDSDLSARALHFAIDCAELRAAALPAHKLAVIAALDELRLRVAAGMLLHLRLSTFGYTPDTLHFLDETETQTRPVTVSDIDTAKAWVTALVADKNDSDWTWTWGDAIWFKFYVLPEITNRRHYLLASRPPTRWLDISATEASLTAEAIGHWQDLAPEVTRHVLQLGEDLEVIYAEDYDTTPADGVPEITDDADADGLTAALFESLFET
jgi:hypothetical protein